MITNQVLAEFLGTFVFFSAIYMVGKPIPIALALLVAIYIFGPISGGHFNSTVSITKYLAGEINDPQLIGYIIAQIIGGVMAVQLSQALPLPK